MQWQSAVCSASSTVDWAIMEGKILFLHLPAIAYLTWTYVIGYGRVNVAPIGILQQKFLKGETFARGLKHIKMIIIGLVSCLREKDEGTNIFLGITSVVVCENR